MWWSRRIRNGAGVHRIQTCYSHVETDNNETTLRTRMHAESLDLHFRTSGHTQQQQCVQKARVWGPLPLPSVQVFTQGEATQKRAEWQGQHCL